MRSRIASSIDSSFEHRLYLFSSATAMGVVGIWGMHIVGDYSLVMGNGAAELQLKHEARAAVASCVVPTVGMSIAFLIADARNRKPVKLYSSLLLAGVLMGLVMASAHYASQCMSPRTQMSNIRHS